MAVKEKIKIELRELIDVITTLTFLLAYSESMTGKYDDNDIKRYEETINDYNNEIYVLSEQYNIFYAKACRLISVVLPERLQEFKSCYIYDKKASERGSFRTISDYFKKGNDISARFDNAIQEHTYNLFIQQKNILLSADAIINSVLFGIENILQFNLLIDELDIAQDLLNKKFIRPAGVIVSVALEGHLKSVCKKYPNIKLKKNDTLSNFIEYLRQEKIIDVIEERKLRCLCDIRNLCCHKKDHEPTETEVQDLLSGTKRVLSEIN